MPTRVKVTYVAVIDQRPVVSASTFKDLKEALDDYYAVATTEAKCLGFIPYESKYPDEYEGHYSYTYLYTSGFVKLTEIETVKVYCINYFPHTIYEYEAN